MHAADPDSSVASAGPTGHLHIYALSHNKDTYAASHDVQVWRATSDDTRDATRDLDRARDIIHNAMHDVKHDVESCDIALHVTVYMILHVTLHMILHVTLHTALCMA